MARKMRIPTVKQRRAHIPLPSSPTWPKYGLSKNRVEILGHHPPSTIGVDPANLVFPHSALVSPGRERRPQNQHPENLNIGHTSKEWQDALSRKSRRVLWAQTKGDHGNVSSNFICKNLEDRVWITPISSFTLRSSLGVNLIPLGERRNPTIGASSSHRHLPQTWSKDGNIIGRGLSNPHGNPDLPRRNALYRSSNNFKNHVPQHIVPNPTKQFTKISMPVAWEWPNRSRTSNPRPKEDFL